MIERSVLLLFCIILCCSCAELSRVDGQVPRKHGFEYSFIHSNQVGEYHDGIVGRVAVNFDSAEDSGEKRIAIVDMDRMPFGVGLGVLFIRVRLFLPECRGVPVATFDYNSQSYNQNIAPQTFSISDDACVEITYYSRNADGDLWEADNFRIRLRQ